MPHHCSGSAALGGKSSEPATINTGMKTFVQFVNETIQPPAEKSPKTPPRKIAGHTFAEEQSEAKPEARDSSAADEVASNPYSFPFPCPMP